VRNFPRFSRNSRPECPRHGASMRLVDCAKPSWMLVSLTEPVDRQVYRCSHAGCPRVASAESAGDIGRVYPRQSFVL
jgi:hypothetical protein